MLQDNYNWGLNDLGALVLLYITLNNNTFNEWKVINDQNRKSTDDTFIFDIRNNTDLFFKWSNEDCHEAIEVGQELKKVQFQYLSEFFIKSANAIIGDEGGTAPLIEYILNDFQKGNQR